MKKIILTLLLVSINLSIHSQWYFDKYIDSDNTPYTIAYTDIDQDAFLKLENINSKVFFYLEGEHFCEDNPLLDITFITKAIENGKRKIFLEETFSVNAFKSEDNKFILIENDLERSILLAQFKNCTKIRIRIRSRFCNEEIYYFDMSNSTKAYNFVKKN